MLCEICGKNCKNSLSLSMHISKAHHITSQEYYDTYLKTLNEDICPICGNRNGFISITKGYFSHCSNKCSQLDSSVQEKIKTTNLKLYNVERPLQSKIIMDKLKATNQTIYGVDYTFQAKSTKEKMRQTWKNHYGENIINPFQAAEVKDKIKDTRLKIIGVEHPMQCKDIIDKTQQSIANTRRKNNNRSQIELYFEDICIKNNISFIHNYQDERYKRDDGYLFKCDFYFPKDDIFIEINYMATHNNHLFDSNNTNDIMWLEHCKTNPKNWVEEKQVQIWANEDVQKINCAKNNHLKYYILWNYEDIDNFFKNYIKQQE